MLKLKSATVQMVEKVRLFLTYLCLQINFLTLSGCHARVPGIDNGPKFNTAAAYLQIDCPVKKSSNVHSNSELNETTLFMVVAEELILMTKPLFCIEENLAPSGTNKSFSFTQFRFNHTSECTHSGSEKEIRLITASMSETSKTCNFNVKCSTTRMGTVFAELSLQHQKDHSLRFVIEYSMLKREQHENLAICFQIRNETQVSEVVQIFHEDSDSWDFRLLAFVILTSALLLVYSCDLILSVMTHCCPSWFQENRMWNRLSLPPLPPDQQGWVNLEPEEPLLPKPAAPSDMHFDESQV